MFQFPSPTANPLSPLAILPPAPAAEMSPAYSHDPAVQANHQQLAALHCAAFVSLHGVPPQYVSIEPMIIHSHDDGPPQPVIAARLQSRVDRHSVDWFNAFGMGLTLAGLGVATRCSMDTAARIKKNCGGHHRRAHSRRGRRCPAVL